jgi:hypothetical protein
VGQLGGGVVLDRAAGLGSGVVDQDVDAAEGLDGAVEEALGGLEITDVDRGDERSAAGVGDLGGHALEAGAAARGEDDLAALGGEAARGGGAHAGRGPGDDDRAIGESLHGA